MNGDLLTTLNFKALYDGLCYLSDQQGILKRVEAKLIKEAMVDSKGVLSKAAKILGMTVSTLKKRITEYEIE